MKKIYRVTINHRGIIWVHAFDYYSQAINFLDICIKNKEKIIKFEIAKSILNRMDDKK